MHTNNHAQSSNKIKDWTIIILPLLVVIITCGFNYWLWHNQHTTEYNEKLIEKRMGLVDEVSSAILEYQRAIRYSIQYQALVDQYTDHNKEKTVEDASKIDKKIKEMEPEVYNNNLQLEPSRDRLFNKFIICQEYYGQETNKAIEEFKSNVINKNYQDYENIYEKYELNKGISKNKLYPQPNEIYYNVDELKSSIDQYINGYSKNILDAMYRENILKAKE
ncbi:hypothetical protein REC12_22540 [Desulfosporosinus sp. PR]|uniref:hypothetical protein n=1 Tax=Candidatus Desulfosporosinus nitrosoreducens TaxID=3401928 RepID=UPI0027EC502C|nr:hypothetical protein [Desulfosporosinus sp. PR]MDQ7096377.1 hypothetical protein [Desulfosporosinus sp. PR]